MPRGIAVSPGIAVGKAYCIHEIFVGSESRLLDENDVVAELGRFERARELAADDLKAVYEKVASQVGRKEATFFQVQETILHDPSFTRKVRDWIVNERQSSESALHHVLNEYASLFARTKDEYLRERLSDIRDVIVRVSGHLSKVLKSDADACIFAGPLILVADELLLSHVVMIGTRDVAGIVTQSGGSTSHAAILARSRGIPAVTGVRGILKQVTNGTPLIVDGRDGNVFINPNSETESAYRKLQREFVDLKDTLAANRDLPARSRDGIDVQLLANINHVNDAKAAAAMGAAGIGLYRTEYLFLSHPDVPDEEEQLAAYREIIAASPDGLVTIRTLDLGGDKTIPYLGHQREANPFLGWRSIRLSFEHPEFFIKQIRAVLRSAASEEARGKHIRLMFPMITTLEEIHRVRGMVRKAKVQLDQECKAFGEVAMGMMVEVPAAAITIESFLPAVDFVSIGSNDLIQYLMAADRDNPKVNHLCQPLSPPVLKVLSKVIGACSAAAKPVTLCGEMAGAPRAFPLLFAMGLRSFSMSPAFIPTIKELAAHLTLAGAKEILDRVMKLKTTTHIAHFMARELEQLCPNLKLLDFA